MFKPHLGAELSAKELANLSRIALEGEGEIRDVEDHGLDAVAPSLDLADHARHLVPVGR